MLNETGHPHYGVREESHHKSPSTSNMKRIKIVLAIGLVAIAMSACSLTSILNPNETVITKRIVGTWYLSLINSNVCPSNEMEVTIFYEDNTGKWCHIENDEWVETEFVYTIENQQITQSFPNSTTQQLTVSSISKNTLLLKDEQTDMTWNLLKVSHNYNEQLVGSWKRTTEPMNEPNTLNDVYTFRANGTYSVLRSATSQTEQGTWIAYGCVLYLSGEPYLTRTTTSATGYNQNMSWQTVTTDHQPSACAMQRIN